jgi:RNA-directed DNA polymerase
LPATGILTKQELATTLGSNPREIDYVLNRLGGFYRPKNIPKKDGSFRTLLIPRGRLRDLQQAINATILSKLDWPASVQGGVRGRSVRTSALAHVGKELVIAVDVKNFFPSVTPQRVEAIFGSLGMATDVCGILVKLTTWNGQLPQGAPTSTALANLALARADARISGFCRQQEFTYTRYVDDITVSGSRRLLGFKNLLQRIVTEEGFQLKSEKTEIMPKGTRQMVTKVIVNQKLNLPREKRQELRLEALKGNSGELTDKLKGRINWLRYLNPGSAERIFAAAKQTRRSGEKGSN